MDNSPLSSRVVVISIGRSGTSLFARILHEVLGVDFGDESTHIPRNYNNPDGYFENAEFMAFNDRVLRAINSWVLTPPPINYVDLMPDEMRAQFVAEAKSRLAHYATDKPSFGWKDPRLSFTLPIWREACPNITPIIAFRRPISVLSSIAAQLERPIDSLGDLWLEYYRRVFTYTAGMPSYIVSFDDLLSNPVPVVMGMATHLGVTLTETEAQAKLTKIVKPQQSRHSSAENASNGTPILDYPLYRYLRESVQNGGQPDRERVLQLLQHAN